LLFKNAPTQVTDEEIFLLVNDEDLASWQCKDRNLKGGVLWCVFSSGLSFVLVRGHIGLDLFIRNISVC
jgi:hypothetical protein